MSRAVCGRCGSSYPASRVAVCPRCVLESEIPAPIFAESLELIEEIGRGGMGSVWKARHLRLDRLVAVKFLAAEWEAAGELAGRLEREAHALARLSHSGIVAIHDFGREDGRPYLVMEYVEGRSLAESLPLPPERARDVALQVLDALAYAHERGVVHRDVKPGNVLVGADGRVKVSDFGIARLMGPEPSGWTLTTAGRAVGTPAYMAPEALSGAPPDPRMDVFSVGVLLYEMVTGRRPTGDFPPLDGPLDVVVRRALAPDADRRYASAREMHEALAALAPAHGTHLPADERQWLYAVAFLLTLATAAALFALLRSFTPRVLPAAEVEPLIMVGGQPLPDGRIVSRARFETWPTLAALAAGAGALLAHGLLRRHWRQAGLDRPRPDEHVAESRWVLTIGLVAVAVYLARRLAEAAGHHGASPYVPILGGLIEIAALFLAWTAVLQAWRIGRPLAREGRLWLGLGLALVPPVVDFAGFLAAWKP